MSQQNYAGGHVNKFRNGTFESWQRGNSIPLTSTVMYTADGWIVAWSGAGVTINKVGYNGQPLSTLTGLQVQGAAGNTITNVSQRIESSISSALGSVPVTVQLKINNQTGAAITPSLLVQHPTTVDNWASTNVADLNVPLQSCPINVWTTVAYTFNVPIATAQLGLGIIFGLGPVNPSGKNIFIAEADIRPTIGYPVGLCAYPPAPELRTGNIDYILNNRYYQAPGIGTLFQGYIVTGSAYEIIPPFLSQMRTTPTMTSVDAGNNGFPAGLPTIQPANPFYFTAVKTCNADVTNGYYQFTWTASAEL
jgi:hypothetical protein